MATWTTPTPPSVGTQAASSWADFVTADLALIASPAYFFAYTASAGSFPAGANYDFDANGTIVEDTLSGWNATNNNYLVKSPGLYLVITQIMSSAAGGIAPTPIIVKNGTGFSNGSLPGTNAFSGGPHVIVMRCALNDTLAMRTNTTFTTNSQTGGINDFFAITQLSWV